MAETVTTLERAIEVLEQRRHQHASWEGRLNEVGVPVAVNRRTGNALQTDAACFIANQLLRDAEPKVAEPDARSQILALADLRDGWYDGHGAAYDVGDLARVADVIGRLAAVGKARVYPMPDGGVCVEWGDRPKDDSIEIDPKTLEASWHLYDHHAGRESCGETKAREGASEPLALSLTPDELGRLAYEVMQRAIKPHLASHRYTPAWDGLDEMLQAGWIAAAEAVVDQMPADKPPRVGPMTKKVMACIVDHIEGCDPIDASDPTISIAVWLRITELTAALRECGMEGDSR